MPDPGPVGERPLPVLGERTAAASRTASWGRMSALGAPRANEIVSPAIAPTLATSQAREASHRRSVRARMRRRTSFTPI